MRDVSVESGPGRPFAGPPDADVITLVRILRGESPLLLVTHDADDGTWQFLDGSHVFEEDAVIVSLGEVAEYDPTILELADLPVGWYARRGDTRQPWGRAPGEPPT